MCKQGLGEYLCVLIQRMNVLIYTLQEIADNAKTYYTDLTVRVISN